MADFTRACWPANASLFDGNGAGASLADRALASNTLDAYDRAARAFDDWRGSRQETDETLAAYLEALFGCGLATATAEIAAAGVRHRAGGDASSSPVGPLSERTLRGYRRAAVGRGAGQVDGINWAQADRMAELAERCEGCKRAGGLRDALLIRLMSDCLLRVGEASALDVRDIAFAADGSLRVTVRRSKTDQEGRGVVLYAGPETGRLARLWLAKTGGEGALFRQVNKAGRTAADGRLSARSMRDIVKRWAEAAGIDGRVSGHSLRIGAAQSLRAAAASLAELMAAGRWTRVDTVTRYTREEDAATGAVARLRYGAFEERKPPHRSSRAARKAEGRFERERKRLRKERKRMRRTAKKMKKSVARLEKAVLVSSEAD